MTSQDTEIDKKFMDNIEKLKTTQEAVLEDQGDYDVQESGCFYTRKQMYRKIRSQMQLVIDKMESKEDNIESILYEPAFSTFFSILLRAEPLTEHRIEEAKAGIHLCNATASHFEEHGILSPVGENDFLFGYLYSILDTLIDYEEWGFADEETSSS